MRSRRSFLRLAAAGAAGSLFTARAAFAKKKPKRVAAPAPAAPIKPRVLQPGDTVGLIAPASYTFDLWRLDDAAARVQALNLKPKFGKYVRGRRGFLSGTDDERLEDLHAMFADSAVAAVFALQGGYGTPRLLDRIDYDLIRRNPKLLLGFSDITGLHLAIGKKSGLVTLHGPNMLGSLPPRTFELLKKALFVAEPLGDVTNPEEADPLSAEFPLHTVAPGVARGRMVGGNLTLISATMGTPFEIETKDRILLIEDTGEAPYRIDRMLVQLKLAGKLQEAAGIVFGTCSDCAASRSSFELTLSLSEVLDELLAPLGKPVLAGLLFGHTKEKSIIPMGVEAELDAGAKRLTIVESATLSG
ncbi:MAG TPA: LD-carboxypeptidase [Thermoanaerobaculia bacterium]|nr:LD-carboxypeptidase [Thermoanaerobaculia bacterium]